jgi:hypothetical protein
MRRKPSQKLTIKLAIVSHTQRLAGLPFLIHRHEDGKLLVSVTSDKLFHTAAAPPCAWGFARSLRKTPLQRFHSIKIAPAAPRSGGHGILSLVWKPVPPDLPA